MTASNFAIEQALIPALVQILNNINNLNPNPQSGPNNPGSSTPPLFELINLQQYLQQNGNTQQTIINIQNGGANTNTQTQLPATFTIVLGASATSVVTWTSPVSGTWETGSNWSDLTTPGAPEYVNIAQPVKVTVETSESADGLRIGAGAILNLASGATLEVSQGIADFGTLRINSSGSDPAGDQRHGLSAEQRHARPGGAERREPNRRRNRHRREARQCQQHHHRQRHHRPGRRRADSGQR